MNNIGVLADELFKQLRNLNEKEGDELKLEINKAKAVVSVAGAITDIAKLSLAVEHYRDQRIDNCDVIPTLLEAESYIKEIEG